MEQDLIRKLVDEALAENSLLFLIDLDFSPSNRIKVIVDGDEGISLKECIRISRYIEHNLDRNKEDFAIEVTSPDITQPLSVQRQYKKNINRVLSIKTDEGDIEGTLVDLSEKGVLLQWKVRQPKPVGKGKVTIEKSATIAYKNIREAKVKIIS